jgi:hypothetical protein
MVGPTYTPNYSGDKDREDSSLRTAEAKSS